MIKGSISSVEGRVEGDFAYLVSYRLFVFHPEKDGAHFNVIVERKRKRQYFYSPSLDRCHDFFAYVLP